MPLQDDPRIAVALATVFDGLFERAIRAGRVSASDDPETWRELFLAEPSMTRIVLVWNFAATA